MKGFFSPAIRLMNRLRYRGKFAVIGSLAFFSIAILLTSIAIHLYGVISLARNEHVITELMGPLHKQIQLTQQHRGMSAAFLSGATEMRRRLEDKQVEVDAAVKGVDTIHERYPELLGSGAEWRAINSDWDKLRSSVMGLSVAETVAMHTQLIERILRYQVTVADSGGLSLDSEIESYYLAESLFRTLPDMLERLGKIRAKGTAILVTGRLADADRVEFAVQGILLNKSLEALKDNLEKVGRHSPQTAAKLARFSKEIAAASLSALRTLDTDVIGNRFAVPPQDFFEKLTEGIDIGYRELFDTLLPTLGQLLDSRIRKLQIYLALEMGVAVVILFLLIYVSIGAYYSIVESVRRLSAGAASIAGGNLNINVRLEGRDELALVANGFNAMATTLDDQLRRSKRTNEELTQALAAAKLSDQAKDEFLANVSHELRTPLNGVIGMASLAQSISANPKLRDYLDKIVGSGQHLSRIVNELLDLSKIAAGRMEFEHITFSLNSVIERSRSVMAHRAAEKGLDFVTEIDAAVPDTLIGDPSRIQQILLNLLGNAIKFTQQGRVAVRVGTHAREGDRVCLDIEVEDTGIGIRAEHMKQLFQPFSQADATMSRRFGGTGLGLTISRRLAEMMGGDIGVTSREGLGSIFRVRIWLELGNAADLPPLEHVANKTLPRSYTGVRVLVVEDQALNREIVEALLADVGIAPCMAVNGQEALDILTQCGPEAFDLVLMDIQMPVMDGLAATRAIRERGEFASLPVIGMTAHTMEHEKRICAEAGMNDHIGKPFDNASFYSTLARWIAEAKQQYQSAGEAEDDPNSSNELPTLRGIDTQAGLARFAGNEHRYRHWLMRFAEEASGKVAELSSALGAGERETARKAAHSLKGQAGMLGLIDFHEVVTVLEADVAKGGAAEDLLRSLEEEARRVCENLKNISVGNSSIDLAVECEAIPRGRPERRQRPRSTEKLILLIDDDPAVLETLDECLRLRYQTRLAPNGVDGLKFAQVSPLPDLILLDIELPDIQGYEVCRALKADPETARIPVIFLSSHTHVGDITRGLEVGAVDYINKPVDIPILMARVQTHVRLQETTNLLRNQNMDLEGLVTERTRDLEAKTAELQSSQYLSIMALGSIAETRDNETGNHIYRTSAYVELLANRLAERQPYRGALAADVRERIAKSAPLHDIGKVGIPDHILLKPGPLTTDEFGVMKRHTTLGRDAIRSAEIRAKTEGSFLRTASEIAYSHHERWDGRGYPNGLSGEDIPLSARIMAVADTYDALVSDRVYKAKIAHSEAVAIIRAESGGQFDPGIVACFLEVADEIEYIASRFSDAGAIEGVIRF